MTQEQEKSKDELRVSPDGRSVNFRGEEFTFTSTQAIVFETLYNAYKNGTPEISEVYIMNKLGKESGHVKDIFKRHPNWKQLIGPGRRRGNFRLKIDV